jgi:hypothetical protein
MVNVKNHQDSRMKLITRSASKPKTLNHRTGFQGGSFGEIEMKAFNKHCIRIRNCAQHALIYLKQFKIAKQHWFGVVGASGCKFTPHLLGTRLWVGFGQIYGGPTFGVLCLLLDPNMWKNGLQQSSTIVALRPPLQLPPLCARDVAGKRPPVVKAACWGSRGVRPTAFPARPPRRTGTPTG